MIWDDYLVREIVEKRCIICVGSGFSAQAETAGHERPVGWIKLLNILKDRLIPDPATKTIIDDYIYKSRLLDAAEIISEHATGGEFSRIIKEQFLTPDFIPAAVHNALLEMSPKIVITPNYDCILEKAYNAGMGRGRFTTVNYSADNFLDKIRSPEPIIAKIHGCADLDAAKVILSRSNYYSLRKDYSQFFALISNLMQINTVLFLGCGLEDPDLNLILENNTISAKTNFQNYALIGDKSANIHLKGAYKRQYNLKFVEYVQSDADDHSNFEGSIDDLKNQVNDMRIKFGGSP